MQRTQHSAQHRDTCKLAVDAEHNKLLQTEGLMQQLCTLASIFMCYNVSHSLLGPRSSYRQIFTSMYDHSISALHDTYMHAEVGMQDIFAPSGKKLH